MSASTRRWYVASTRRTLAWDSDGARPVPAGDTHAKEVGTTMTACGTDASNMTKFWEMTFDPTSKTVCELCGRAIAYACDESARPAQSGKPT